MYNIISIIVHGAISQLIMRHWFPFHNHDNLDDHMY